MKDGIHTLLKLPPQGPLNGYLVLEIGGNVSGPMAGESLARDGAQVIKIELPGGDPARGYLSKAIFTTCNAAKASITIDKNNADDARTYAALLEIAHVIIDNRSPDAKKRDVPLQSFLAEQKSHPVNYCSIVGYDSQPRHNQPALDVAVQANIGMAMVNGPTANSPLKVGFVVIDITTGLEAASNIKGHLLGLARNRIPLASHKVIMLEQSMAKTGALLMSGQYLMAYTQQKDNFREGNKDLWIAPFSFYQTRDEMISLAIIGDPLFKIFCEKVLNQPAFAQKYPTNKIRLESPDFEVELQAILKSRGAYEWIALCSQHHIVCTKVNTITQMLQQPFGRQMIAFTQDGTPIISNPGNSSAYSSSAERLAAAPTLDEHRKHILALLDMNPLVGGVTLTHFSALHDDRAAFLPAFTVRKNPTLVNIPTHDPTTQPVRAKL